MDTFFNTNTLSSASYNNQNDFDWEEQEAETSLTAGNYERAYVLASSILFANPLHKRAKEIYDLTFQILSSPSPIPNPATFTNKEWNERNETLDEGAITLDDETLRAFLNSCQEMENQNECLSNVEKDPNSSPIENDPKRPLTQVEEVSLADTDEEASKKNEETQVTQTVSEIAAITDAKNSLKALAKDSETSINFDSIVKKAKRLAKNKFLPKSEKQQLKQIKRNAEQRMYDLNRAECLLKLANYGDALFSSENVLLVFPTHPRALEICTIAQILSKNGSKDKDNTGLFPKSIFSKRYSPLT